MKNIIDIYKEYKIMPNLVMHQVRVAAVAMQICDSLDMNIDKDSVIKACLLHDMANIIKFNLEYFPEQNKPEGIDFWQNVKNDYILKYGSNEHIASLEIAKELGVSSYIYDLVNCVDSSTVEYIAKGEDFGKKICIYADNRVTPNGVVSAEERSLEAMERYKNHPHSFNEERRSNFNKYLFSIEDQIFSNINLKPEDINDESIIMNIKKLEAFSI